MTLGARVIKTGLAISLSLYICHLLELQPAVLAAIASIFIMQPSLYGTWRHVWQQIQTNTLGALVAFAAIHFIGNDLFSVGLVSVLVIAISLKMKMGNTIGLTLVTVLAIMETPGADVAFAVNRFAVILIGIAAALVVNVAIAPPNFRKMFEEKVKSVYDEMSLLLRTAISDEMTEKAYKQEKQVFADGLMKCAEMFGMFDEERRRMAKIKPVNARRIVVYKYMVKSLHKGENILELIRGHYFQYEKSENSGKLLHEHLDRLIKYHEYILLKFAGKIKHTDHHAGAVQERNQAFMKTVLDVYEQDHHKQADHLRLVLIGSSIYEYGLLLLRMDKLVEQFQKKHVNRRRNGR